MSEPALKMAKDALRERLRTRRAALDAAWTEEAGAQIDERLLDLPEVRAAHVLMGYLAVPGEVRVDAVLRAAEAAGIRVCVPAAHGTPREYDPAWLPADEGLRAAAWGIREPACPEWVAADTAIDVVLVPGVAFDAHGGRLGHGKGYYDGLLARLGARARCRIGVAFGFQLVEAVPCGPRDVRMDAVVVEARVYRPAAVSTTGANEVTQCGL